MNSRVERAATRTVTSDAIFWPDVARRVVVRSEARAEIFDARRWYEERAPGSVARLAGSSTASSSASRATRPSSRGCMATRDARCSLGSHMRCISARRPTRSSFSRFMVGRILTGGILAGGTRSRKKVSMVISSGKVVAGRIIVDGEPLPDGTVVTVLSREGDETFTLDSAAEAELLESMAEGDRGETVSADDVLGSLRNLE